MSHQRKFVRGLKIGNEFRPDTGIIYVNKEPDDVESVQDIEVFPARKDPVTTYNKSSRKRSKSPVIAERPPTPDTILNPSISTRIGVVHPHPPERDVGDPLINYEPPPLKGTRKAKRERKRKEEEARMICDYEVLRMPSPVNVVKIEGKPLEVTSPEASKAKVTPKIPSIISGLEYPYPSPTPSELELHKPKSGIIINEKQEFFYDSETSSEEEEEERKPKVRKIYRKADVKKDQLGIRTEVKEETDRLSTILDEDFEDWEMFGEGEEAFVKNKSTAFDEETLLRQVRRKVSQVSKTTSLNSKDLEAFQDVSWDQIPAISKLVQTFRTEQETRKSRKKIKKGTLESHSYTKVKQKIFDDFCFKCLQGTIHQGNENFSVTSRNKQGICVPIVAYCFAKLRKPKTWTDRMVDEVVEIGDKLYLDSVCVLHMHQSNRELTAKDVNNFCCINNRKVKFEIDDPEIHGQVRSTDKRIYNVTKGLKIYFRRHKAAIFQAGKLNWAIWKVKKYYYIFDGNPRRKDLCEDVNGAAVLICVQNLKSIISILLDRSNLENPTFLLSRIRVVRVLCPNEKEEDEDLVEQQSEYNIISDKKAVVLGSFNLSDKCFCFSRNKQAWTMGVVSLVYSRITSPNSWHKQTIDKILIIGNQLYLECVQSENTIEIGLEHLPAVFTIGPYIVEIFIYANVAADVMYKKSQCCFQTELEIFFERNTHAIVQIGKSILAIWLQRNMFYCFDPYSRNTEGLKCRNGSACVTMNSDLETLVNTVLTNFEDKDCLFYFHALKVLRINRDPALNRLFPKTKLLNEIPIEHFKRCKVRKSKKKATEKPITVDFTEYAMRKLLALESPQPSIVEVGSNIGSINKVYLPPFLQKLPPKIVIRTKISQMADVADLDSPALSETQMSLEKPALVKPEEEITLMDLDSFDLTQEELEQQADYEGEDFSEVEDEEMLMAAGDYEQQQEGEEEYYLGKSQYSQVESVSLESLHLKMTEEVNTDISYQYKILPALELPPKSKRDADAPLAIDEDLQKAELEKKSYYKSLQDESQIIRGTKNVTQLGEAVDDVVPYISIMASAYAEEQPIYKWTNHSVDLVLKSGMELYQAFEEPYYKVEDFHLEFVKRTIDLTLEIVLDTYVGQQLFKTDAGRKSLETLLELQIFSKSSTGLIILPEYCCTVFFKRNLLYLFDCFACDETGKCLEQEGGGTACMVRFKDLESLVARILHNRNERVIEDQVPEYTHFILAIPDILVKPDKKRPEKKPQAFDDEGVLIEPEITQSQELAKPHNFVDLPDDTQLLRGTTEIKNFGQDSEILGMAPFVCMMASAVSYKYSIVTWSSGIINYVLRAGSELYRKTNVRFDQVSKLEVPMICLGKMNFSLEVNYLFDAPMKHIILEASLQKVLRQNSDWVIIATQEFVCGAVLKNEVYYLYDGFPTNEVGLSEGPEATGFASLARFKDLRSMVSRIMYNKNKREEPEKLEYTRFILSSCRARFLRPGKDEKKPCELKKRKAEKAKKETEAEEAFEIMDEEEDEEEEEESEEKKEPPKNKVGFQVRDNFLVIEGTSSLKGRKTVSEELKEDHFICLCACLMVIKRPVRKWDTRTVNKAIEQGKHIFSHAENLELSDKRTIKNILIGRHYFDIIVKPIKINNWRKNRNLETGIATIMGKRKFCLVQLPNCCIVIYKESEIYFVFDPYSWEYKKKKETKTVQAGWTLYDSAKRLKRKVKSCQLRDAQSHYVFYSFEVISVKKAPKKAVLVQKLEQYQVDRPPKQELKGKPFFEQESWLNIHQSPWSRLKSTTADGKARDAREAKWHYWDIEYPHDLYSLTGNLHQTSRRFKLENRGKQTLSNMITAIAMTNIYEFTEWKSAVLDSILISGDAYFTKCIEDISEANYELALEDLVEDCAIFPYDFKVSYSPVVQGTMFLVNARKFNLYKALRYFFDTYTCRSGVIIAQKGGNKRMVSFGKLRDNEYYMYDCQAKGPPMFFERHGVSYILRCTTMARLLHCLVVTLKGGDFYIYEVNVYDFEPAKEKDEEEDDNGRK